MQNTDRSPNCRYCGLLLLGLVAGPAYSGRCFQPDRKAAIAATAPTQSSGLSDHTDSDGTDEHFARVITPCLGVGSLRFGMNRQQMELVLGKADRSEGRAFEYLSKGMAVIGSRDAAVAVLMFGGFCAKDEVLVGRCKYSTSKGIGMGSSHLRYARQVKLTNW
jgi:hypothetical protein